MHHVVPPLADAAQVVIPVGGKVAHELGQDGAEHYRLDWHLLTLESEPWTYIDVVGRRARRLCCSNVGEGPFWEWGVGRIEGVGIGLVDGDVDLGEAIEVWLEPASGCQHTAE